jgi:hypothetical protein
MSKPFQIDGLDMQKITKGVLIAGAGLLVAVIPLLIDGVTYKVTFGTTVVDLTAIVAFIASNVINALRLYMTGK